MAGALLDPLAWVLFLAGVFDGLSDNWLHGVVLMAAALAVWYEAWARSRGRPARPSVPLLAGGPGGRAVPAVPAALVVLGVLAYSLVVGTLGRYTWPVTVAVLVPGAVGVVLAWRGPLRPRPVPEPLCRRSIWLWSSVLVAGGLWELTALLLQPSLTVSSTEHPTVSYLMDSVLAGYGGRVVTLAAWLVLGWFLLSWAPGGPVDDVA